MSRLNQYCSVICANILSMGFGVAFAWISPIIPLLLSDDTPLQTYGKLTKDEIAWMSAFICLGTIFGSLIGIIADRYGRKVAMYVLVIPLLVNWLMISFGTTAIELMIARFICGIVAVGPLLIIPMFVTEIAENEIRGSLGSFIHLSINTGYILGYTWGGYLNYYLTSYLGLLFPVVFAIGFIFVPETPPFLASKNKMVEAENSLKFYRGYKKDSDHLSVHFLKELEILKLSATDQNDKNSKLQISDFTNRAAKRAICIGIFLNIASRVGGTFVLTNYAGVIFSETGSSLSPNLSSIIVSVIYLCGTYVSFILVDRAGRKMLLISSALLTGICEFLLGIYLYLKSYDVDVSNFTWLPVACMAGVFFNSSWGLATLPSVILNETLPIKIRSKVGMLCRVVTSGVGFLLLNYFYVMLDTINLYGCMWFLSGTCLIVVLLMAVYLPETKGKSLKEILEAFER